jgi:hypothetical protein
MRIVLIGIFSVEARVLLGVIVATLTAAMFLLKHLTFVEGTQKHGENMPVTKHGSIPQWDWAVRRVPFAAVRRGDRDSLLVAERALGTSSMWPPR